MEEQLTKEPNKCDGRSSRDSESGCVANVSEEEDDTSSECHTDLAFPLIIIIIIIIIILFLNEFVCWEVITEVSYFYTQLFICIISRDGIYFGFSFHSHGFALLF